ncbi:MAG TPA: DUF1819 family protein [Tissierellaceae bacterium]|nr:DUF1819 family protein [Tissierellaceae bacterium]
MNKEQEYSAGAVSKGFWFREFKKYNEFLKEGLDDKEIKAKQRQENVLMAPSKDYGVKMINEVSRRVKVLSENIRNILFDLSIADQKIINVLGLMLTDRLFFEYMYEVYGENIIMGKLEFNNSDTRIFFENKSEQSKKVANFKPYTKKRLVGVYRTYLKEANLIEKDQGEFKFRKHILDINLEKAMRDKEIYPYLRVFLGE